MRTPESILLRAYYKQTWRTVVSTFRVNTKSPAEFVNRDRHASGTVPWSMKSRRAPIRLPVGIAGWAGLVFTIGLGLVVQGQSQTPSGSQSAVTNTAGQQTGVAVECEKAVIGSPYIPVDSWIYPAVMRLYSMGFVDHIYVGMRPWTRKNVIEVLSDVEGRLADSNPSTTHEEARQIYDALNHELKPDMVDPCAGPAKYALLESAYVAFRAISGTSLRDSFHLGSTVINDYGRPYENGLNSYSGLSGYVTAGRYTLYARGEFQGASSATGYSGTLANNLSAIDLTLYTDPTTGLTTYYYPQATIPMGPISSTARGRVMEAYISANVWNHEISFGKVDQWLGPAQGASFAYSNNAENIYAFEINRVEPLRIPLLSSVTGPFRYEFLVGPLHGHLFMPNPAYEANPSPNIPNVINPGDPWMHLEKLSFRPTANLEFGFERTGIWGGEGHGPITLHTFLKSFFSTTAPGGPGSSGPNEKNGPGDPGARFASFDFSYRLPFLRDWLTLYADGEVHDDISPIDAPRRAAWRSGLYLSHVPGAPKLDVRAEGVYTDPPISTSHGGRFMYWEFIQKQGYTNNGQIFGDWIGREDKGGQAWITYHLSGNEWIQLGVRNQKAAKDFIATSTTEYGTTLNDLNVQVVKRIRQNFEINGSFTVEQYKAPIYLPARQTVTTTNIQLTWYPNRKVNF